MSAKGLLRSVLAPLIGSYVALKKALGRGFAGEQAVLYSLDEFLASTAPDSADLTPETFAAWCQTLQRLSSGVRRSHMRVVRNVCLYRRRTEPSCFVPDSALFPPLHQPVQPYIFTEDDIRRLLLATQVLQATCGSPLYREVLRLAVALLYTTGLRRGELLRLTIADFDPQERCLLVRASKFHKSRFLPLSADGVREVQSYLDTRRTRGLPMAPETSLLWHRHCSAGRGYTGTGLTRGIRLLFQAAGVRKPDGRLPRIHDFRHGFAVHALLRWYRAGVDVQARLPHLATYMGHVSIVSTEYYLRLIPDVAAQASLRFAQHCGSLVAAPTGTGALP